MADEIERGEVELHGKKVVNVAVFHMTDPAKYVGDLSIRNPEFQHSLSLLARRLYKAMEVSSGVVD